MKNLLLILASVIILTSCNPQKTIIERYYTKDSTTTNTKETLYRDTNITVNLPKQEITVIDTGTYYNKNSQPITSQKITAETDYAKANTQIINGRLQLQIENKDSARIYIKNAIKEVLRSEINNIVETYKEKKQTEKIIVEYKMRWWQKIFFWIGFICVIIAIVFVIFLKFRR